MIENDKITVNFLTTKEDKNKVGFKDVLTNLLLNGIIFSFDDDGFAFFYSFDDAVEEIILNASKKYPLAYFFWSVSNDSTKTVINKRVHNGIVVKNGVRDYETE